MHACLVVSRILTRDWLSESDWVKRTECPMLRQLRTSILHGGIGNSRKAVYPLTSLSYCGTPPGDQVMKKLLVFVAVASVLGCASRPESIPASFVSHEKFIDLDCPTLATKMTESKAELARVSELQDEKATGDAVGVFLVLIPVSKLTGDYAGEVARLKGQIEAIDTAQVKNKCKQVGANESSPSPVKSSPAAAAPSGAASGPEMRN